MISFRKIFLISILINIIFFSISIKVINAKKNEEIKISDEVIANTQTDLFGGEINGFSISRVTETNLGNLIADALVDYSKNILKYTNYSDYPVVAIQNGGGIRKSIQCGKITKNQVKEVLPYENHLVLYDITPQELYNILENSVSRIKYKNNKLIGIDGRFPQISGMSFIYDYSQNPSNTFENTNSVGSRVLAIYMNGSNEKLDRTDNLTHIILAFNNYCMDGRDGYTMLNKESVIYTGDKLDDIVCEYIYNKNLNYKTNNRITTGESLGKYNQKIRIFFDSEELIFDVLPMIENYKLFIPIRKIAETIGSEILWDEENKSISIKNGNKIINANIDNNEIIINDITKYLNEPIKLVNDRTMVSIDFIRQAFDINIEWDSNYNAAFINTKK